MTPGLRVAGADGCRAGWVVAIAPVETGALEYLLTPTFRDLLQATAGCAVVGIDIPIGLAEAALPGGRPADCLARHRLRPHSSRVFSPPVRAAVHAATYGEASRLNRDSSPHALGISRQSFHISPKIREVDEAMTPDLQRRVREVHPELSFACMNGGAVVGSSKKGTEGRALRLRLLAAGGVSGVDAAFSRWARRDVALDDLVDAAAVWWSARRLLRGEAVVLSGSPGVDSRGLRMEICG